MPPARATTLGRRVAASSNREVCYSTPDTIRQCVVGLDHLEKLQLILERNNVPPIAVGVFAALMFSDRVPGNRDALVSLAVGDFN